MSNGISKFVYGKRFPINNELDQKCLKTLNFYKNIKSYCSQCCFIDINEKPFKWINAYVKKAYNIRVGSFNDDALLGKDFILILRFDLDKKSWNSAFYLPHMYFIFAGPSIYGNTNKSIIWRPVSAIKKKRFNYYSYATKSSDYNIYCQCRNLNSIKRFLKKYYPSFLKNDKNE